MMYRRRGARGCSFVFARTVREALDVTFGEGALPWRSLTPVVECRLSYR